MANKERGKMKKKNLIVILIFLIIVFSLIAWYIKPSEKTEPVLTDSDKTDILENKNDLSLVYGDEYSSELFEIEEYDETGYLEDSDEDNYAEKPDVSSAFENESEELPVD